MGKGKVQKPSTRLPSSNTRRKHLLKGKDIWIPASEFGHEPSKPTYFKGRVTGADKVKTRRLIVRFDGYEGKFSFSAEACERWFYEGNEAVANGAVVAPFSHPPEGHAAMPGKQ